MTFRTNVFSLEATRVDIVLAVLRLPWMFWWRRESGFETSWVPWLWMTSSVLLWRHATKQSGWDVYWLLVRRVP